MSLTAVRNLAVVPFLLIAGLLITGNLYAGTAPYSNIPYSKIENSWGTTFDDNDWNFNQGHYFAEWVGPDNPNRDYGEMPQEDTWYIHEINAPFDMASTSWTGTTVDIATGKLPFQTTDGMGNSFNLNGAIYAMNDTDHIYIAVEVQVDDINEADRLFLYFDPDNIQPVQEFVEGSGFCVGMAFGDVAFNPGVGNTVTVETSFCNGHWLDWDNSGSIDTWETVWPWPQIGEPNNKTYQMENDTGDKDDLTVCPRTAAMWGDTGEAYPRSGAYWANASPNTWVPNVKPDAIQVQFKIPNEHLGCSLALGSTIGLAIQLADDTNPYDGSINELSTELSWWPTNIEASGPPSWDMNDATYMGSMVLNSLNVGDRLWGPWFDITDDRTTFLVLKNVSDETASTKVKFYESVHGLPSERWAPLPGAGDLLLASQCVEIPPHGVIPMQLETLDGGILMNHKGCIEVTNVNLAGYVVSYVGLSSGSTQLYAWSTDLQATPLSPRDWSIINNVNAEGILLANKWYIIDEPGFDFNTSIVFLNPNPLIDVNAKITLYPASYDDNGSVNLCAETGFHPDFDADYEGSSECGDITGDADDVINVPPHQAVELRMWELLNQWVAGFLPDGQTYDDTQDILDPTNKYWHFRKGTVEIFTRDGDDSAGYEQMEDRLDEVLLGITARESASQGWAEQLERYYEQNNPELLI